jgi:UDP-N-acetyl-D-mannosaminuronic acid dehydrogenase
MQERVTPVDRTKSKIAVIGTGRVGLPLALFFRSLGHDVIGIDSNAQTCAQVQAKTMPFAEAGCEELLERYGLPMTADYAAVGDASDIIITVGTPLLQHIEVDLSQIDKVIDAILPHLRLGHHLALRSTVAPGTTAYVQRLIHQKTPWRVGRDIALSFCPERLAEGVALKELRTIPQICGTEDILSANRATMLFGASGVDLFHCDYVSAELAKLFCNTYRYINFAVANQFALIADTYGADVYKIIGMANPKYPRGPIPQPGFTAGTCLRKDFGMINEASPYPDLFLSAWKINEYMPNFLVKHTQRRSPITGQKIAVLGYAFKKDADDVRDSLAPKLIRYLKRENPLEIRVSDPHLGPEMDGIPNIDMDAAVEGVDVIFIATNHTFFKRELSRLAAKAAAGAWIVDLWNTGGIGRIFYRAALVAEVQSREHDQRKAA